MIFVAYKPQFISSNNYLTQLKKEYKTKKMGFSGTLDPFAKGVLVVATENHTKLLRFLNKAPKTYITTFWFGVKSDSFDLENIKSIKKSESFDFKLIENLFNELVGRVKYTPPKYSAKWINGVRAYDLARKEIEFELNEEIMEIYSIKILNYSHPFLSFEVTLSEGGYVRSIADIISQKLNIDITLSSLERIREGSFIYKNREAVDIKKHLNIRKNIFLGDYNSIILGKKLSYENFEDFRDGIFYIEWDRYISIFEITNLEVKYLLNKVELC